MSEEKTSNRPPLWMVTARFAIGLLSTAATFVIANHEQIANPATRIVTSAALFVNLATFAGGFLDRSSTQYQIFSSQDDEARSALISKLMTQKSMTVTQATRLVNKDREFAESLFADSSTDNHEIS